MREFKTLKANNPMDTPICLERGTFLLDSDLSDIIVPLPFQHKLNDFLFCRTLGKKIYYLC